MKRSSSILCGLVAMALAFAAGAEPTPDGKTAKSSKSAKKARSARAGKLSPPPALPVERIVEKNLAARGGLSAWRAVDTLRLTGEMDAGGKQDPMLPFVLSLKRPGKSRMELKFQGQTAVQVWDGKQGWKVRPYLNRNEVESYTAVEAKSAASAAELDGPLVDHAKKGTRVELAGTEVVENRNTYKLKLTLKGGEQRHLWIDAKTFLEAKIEGDPRKLDNKVHAVGVFYREFKSVNGLKFPHLMETVVEGVAGSHRMAIKSVQVNLPLEESLFVKPQLPAGKLATR